ncbi:hypothetical protein [Methylobacterium sp. SD21]|uniref:hypothetical protein n=1 Tax=Methylobacterium litchii TaxID=3138810 RepID=UPI00313B9D60
MATHYEVEALKAALATAEAELSSIRSERNNVDIRAEVERRGGTDHEAVAALLTRHTRRNNDGMLCAVDENGEFRFGNGHGAYMPVTELLDELSSKHPDLFSGKDKSAGKSSHVGPNPFAKGSLNVTQQMILYREQPELAEHLEYLASVGKN